MFYGAEGEAYALRHVYTYRLHVSLTVKAYHFVNGNSPFDGQNGFCTEGSGLIGLDGSNPTPNPHFLATPNPKQSIA